MPFADSSAQMMTSFLTELALRSGPLYYFGWACLAGVLACAGLWAWSGIRVGNVSAWIKPLKFFASVGVFVWTMGWYLAYLGPQPAVSAYTWGVISTLGIELLCVTGQAARGQRSHYNVSSPLNAAVFALMGVAILVLTVWTAYVALLFLLHPLPLLPAGYAWAIRLGLLLFLVFSAQGGLMVSRQAHAVGGPDDGPGLPALGWSTRHGDLRVAHFVGLHALQVLPALAWYGRLGVPATAAVALLYGGLAGWTLVNALRGRPFWGLRRVIEAA